MSDIDRDALVRVVAEKVDWVPVPEALADDVADVVLPLIAAQRDRWIQQGRNEAAQAIEDYIGTLAVARAISPVLDSLEVVAHKPVQGEAMHKVIGYHAAQAAAALARGTASTPDRTEQR